MDLLPLTIERLIVHEIPKQVGGYVAPTLSAAATPLDGKSRSFFELRTMESLQSHGYAVHLDPDSKSKTPSRVRALLEDASGLVSESQALAEFLATQQSGVPPEGLLTVGTATHGTDRAVFVVKLEKEKGVRVTIDDSSGQTILKVKFVPDLMLSQKTNLFKTGLFFLRNNEVFGWVSDQQTTGSARHVVARFFLRDFLGCQLVQDPHVTTKRFFESVVSFAKKAAMLPEKRGELVMALQTELKSQNSTVRPLAFAKRTLPADQVKAFLSHLKAENVPVSVFDKDIREIESRLSKVVYNFKSGIALSAPSDVLKERVKMKYGSDGAVRVQFEDTVEKVH